VSPGRLEVMVGEARSAEVKEGDTFSVTREDHYRYYGMLDIKGMGFRHDSGLSGRPTKPGVFAPGKMEFAVMKEHVGEVGLPTNQRGFFAEWEMM